MSSSYLPDQVVEPDLRSRETSVGRSKRQFKSRSRARQACLCCRARKVRCDVSHIGQPCSNCYLDSECCVVTNRNSKRTSFIPSIRELPQLSMPPDSGSSGNVPNDAESCARQLPPSPDGQLESTPQITKPQMFETPASQHFYCTREVSADPKPSHKALLERLLLEPQSEKKSNVQSWSSQTRQVHNDAIYLNFPFIHLSNLSSLRADDLRFLDLQGCLRVPVRPYLDDFVDQYFLHVHPTLPLLDEQTFYNIYTPKPGPASSRCDGTVSLLLLQALFFAASPFVNQTTVTALGFPDTQSMRAMLLRRTKLLYEFKVDASHVVNAQAALLLTLSALSARKGPDTSWLSLAIEHAKLADAHIYHQITSPGRMYERLSLKRLWWCCILRDRSISLLLRRSLQISNDHFDFKAHALCLSDLENDCKYSRVHNPAVKRRLCRILICWATLCATLTDLCLLVFPMEHQCLPARNRSGATITVQQCKTSLSLWDTVTKAQLKSMNIEQSQTPNLGDCKRQPEKSDNAVFIYVNLMYMYFHTARTALCHFDIRQAHLRRDRRMSNSFTRSLSETLAARNELQDAICAIMDCNKLLVERGLLHRLPISAVGCIFLPLVLNIIDLKLSPSEDTLDTAMAIKVEQATILAKTIETFRPLYDGIEWVLEIVRHIVSTTRLEPTSPRANWADIFAFQPICYLRLAWTLDQSLRKGFIPSSSNVPIALMNPTENSLDQPLEPPDSDHYDCSDYFNAADSWHSSDTVFTFPDSTSYDETLMLDEAFLGNLEQQLLFPTPRRAAGTNEPQDVCTLEVSDN